MTALLEARHVTKIFGGGFFTKSYTTALENFSMTIENDPPSVTAVVGESGSGKTTLARLLLGLVEPTRGQVLYKGEDLRKIGGRERRVFRRDVQVIFQDPFEVYNPFYKVDHVLTTPIEKFGLAKSRQERDSLVVQVLEAVGLRPEETLGRHPHQLSGGQRQRIMVARALLLRPRVILADEPVSMIDASLRATILGSLLKLNQEFGISILYITHDLTTAYQVSENIVVLYRGNVCETGDVELVVKKPLHPYTRLLVGSVPLPDVNRRWAAEAPASSIGQKADPNKGCRFANRCPNAMEKCIRETPPLYRVDEKRAASCYLYDDKPQLRSEDMMEVFIKGTPRLKTVVGVQ